MLIPALITSTAICASSHIAKKMFEVLEYDKSKRIADKIENISSKSISVIIILEGIKLIKSVSEL